MKDFEETRPLANSALHDLLAQGDPRDRVLAIWALALRVPGASTMVAQLRTEPDPGVRRALSVVLAGHGELDLVVAIARHDPSVHVRASAIQMVVRFASAGRVPWSIVVESLKDAAEVRAAIVSQLDVHSPPELHTVASSLLADPEEPVRREAVETCAKLVRGGVLDGAVVVAFLERVGRGERAHAVGAWFSLEQPDKICSLLEPASREVRETALCLQPQLARTVLAPLVASDPELFARLEDPLSLELADASLEAAVVLAIDHLWRSELLRHVTGRLSQIASATGELRAVLVKLRAACERGTIPNPDAAEQGLMACDDELDELDEPHDPEVREALLFQLARLLGAGTS